MITNPSRTTGALGKKRELSNTATKAVRSAAVNIPKTGIIEKDPVISDNSRAYDTPRKESRYQEITVTTAININ